MPLNQARVEEVLGFRRGRWFHTPERYLEYFQAALKLLLKGHCTGAYAKSKYGHALASGRDKHAKAWCAQGALERVTPEHKDFAVCKRLLERALECVARGLSISKINDGPGGKEAIAHGYRNVIGCLQAAREGTKA